MGYNYRKNISQEKYFIFNNDVPEFYNKENKIFKL